MYLPQLSVFLENREGRLAEVTRILADSGVNICALSLADTSEFGILRLLVDKPEEALEALSAARLTVRKTEVIAVEIVDRPGGLANVLALLQGSGINVEYMYAFPERKNPKDAIMVFRFEDNEQAVKVLQGANITIVRRADLIM